MPRHAGCALTGLVVLGMLLQPAPANAEDKQATFDNADALSAWKTQGDVSVDAAKDRQGGKGGAMKLAPGSMAVWKLRDGDGAGKVTIWVHDDGTRPADSNARRAGPQWGIIDHNGRVLAMGMTYAPYLAGGKTYCSAEYIPTKKEQPWFGLQYLGQNRKDGWTQWTFDFDAEKGLRISRDNKVITRYLWSKSKVGGFVGVAMIGDAGEGPGQTLWVDDVSVTLGGEMQTTPTPPPPPPPIVPDEDPKLTGPAADIVPALRGKHPRLLFGPEDIKRMRAWSKTPQAKPFMDKLNGYLKVCKAPNHTNFLEDATDGQRQGLWRMPTVAMHYVLTGDKASLDNAVGFMKLLLGLPHWETGEIDNGMSAANIMIGAALAYDWLYDDLDPDFRENFRKKIWYHARAMYHGGHLMKDNKGVHYWEGDPQNNHRWHRNGGLALCALAAYEGHDDQKWLLTKLHEELAFVAKWLPEDGTSHESPTYMLFGGVQLMLAMQASDRCLGTSYLQQPFFKELGHYICQCIAPGLEKRFSYGDGGGGVGPTRAAMIAMKTASMHNQSNVQAMIDALIAKHGPGDTLNWLGALWHDPKLTGGSKDKLATTAFFPDLGLLFVREGWKADDVAAMFKCGPFGGYLLNQFRAETGRGINVAHDDPDAGSFTIFTGGEFVAESDRYSKHKQSRNHNTILINGMGQMVPGRPEGGVWSQPGRGDMSQMAVVTSYKSAGDVVAVEGEIAGSYLALQKRGKIPAARPALNRFRRCFIWVKGQYVLVLDDLRAPEAVDVTWLMQSPMLKPLDRGEGAYVLGAGQAMCEFMVMATQPTAAEVAKSTADHRGEALGWQQLQLKANTQAIRLASVYDPWRRGGLKVDLKVDGDTATVTVTGKGISDTWAWKAKAGRFEPSVLTGKVHGGKTTFTMDQPDKATMDCLKAVRALGRAVNMKRGVKVSASAHEESQWGKFVPTNTVDGDLSAKSSWRAAGDGQWIQYDLAGQHRVAGVRIAFMQGDKRTYDFEVQLSDDGKTWKKVYSGTSSGKIAGFEFIDFEDAPARYVRIVSHGGSKEGFKDWISLTEVEARVAE